MRQFIWVASYPHGAINVSQQHVQSSSVRQIQSTSHVAKFNANIKLNLTVGADMHKDRKPKTQPWKAFMLSMSAAT